MECPFCSRQQTFVINSRITKKNSQVWRRRKCEACKKLFSTYETVDPSYLNVIKKSGRVERFSRMKLYSGIYGATIGSKTPNREMVVQKLTHQAEKKILLLNKKRVHSQEIVDIVLNILKRRQTATFLRFLAYSKDIKSESQMKREMNKYR